jgi:hypothetical protein
VALDGPGRIRSLGPPTSLRERDATRELEAASAKFTAVPNDVGMPVLVRPPPPRPAGSHHGHLDPTSLTATAKPARSKELSIPPELVAVKEEGEEPPGSPIPGTLTEGEATDDGTHPKGGHPPDPRPHLSATANTPYRRHNLAVESLPAARWL